MAGLVMLIIAIILCKIPEWTYNNRMCPPGKEIDYMKSIHDLDNKNISKSEYYRRYNSGYYDKDKGN